MLKIRTKSYGLPEELSNKRGILTHFLGKDKYVTVIGGKNTVLSKDEFYLIPSYSSEFLNKKLVK